MLCPELTRQRCVIEFLTDVNLNNFNFIEGYLMAFLEALSITLGMKIFMGPIVGNDRNEETGENGPSAFVGWTTSGCQVHVWPYKKFVSLDIYSCKEYSVSDVLNEVDLWFTPTKIEVL